MPEPDVILAGASVRSLAESAIRDGLIPLCVDQFGDKDLSNLLLRLCGTTDYLRVVDCFDEIPNVLADIGRTVPLIAAGGIENQPQLMASLRLQRRVLTCSPTVTRELSDPDSLFPVLRHHGCDIPRYLSVSQPLDPHQQLPPGGRWLKKAIRSAGGQGVRVLADDELKEFEASSEIYAQEQINGVSMSATFVSGEEAQSGAVPIAKMIGSCLQLSGCTELNSPPFQFSGNAGPVDLPNDLRERFQRVGQCIADNWPMRGIFGVDFVVKDGRAFAIEVNPRVTAAHELYELANPDQSGHVSVQMSTFGMGAPQELLPKPRGKFARLVLYADAEIRVSSQHEAAMLNLCRQPAKSRQDIWLADIPCGGTVIAERTPFCSIYLNLADRLTSQALPGTLHNLFSPVVYDSLNSLRGRIQEDLR